MFLPNGAGVFVLGILTGWLLDVNLIASGSFLLSELPASAGILVQVVAGFAFTLYLLGLRPERFRIKFSILSVYSTLPFLVLLLALYWFDWQVSVRAFLWFGLAIYAWGFFRWVNDEIALKHLDPGRAQAYFFHMAAAREIGTVLSFITLRFLTPGFTAGQMLQIVATLTVLWMSFVLLQFSPRQNLEIHLESSAPLRGEAPRRGYQAFFAIFILISVVIGAYRLGQEYLTMLVLQVNLGSFDAIKNLQADYFLVISILTVVIGFTAGRYIQNRRPSPMALLFLEGGLLMVAIAVCWAYPVLMAFVAFEVVEVVLKTAIADPANQMILSAFDEMRRTRLRLWRNLFQYSLAGIPVLIALYWTDRMPYLAQTQFWLVALAILLLACLAIYFVFQSKLVALLNRILETGNRVAVVLAAQGLSFLRPRNYAQRMQSLLEHEPGRFLRKTVIVGLGYSRSDSALNTVIREFRSEREEIQLAVLEALQAFRDYRAIQFLVRVTGAQEASRSLQVRMNAGRVIAGLYGKKAIPFLLNGLEDSEPRIVANTLETLGDFKDKKLVRYFMRFVHSPVARVRLNALMGLARLHGQRRANRHRIRAMLEHSDPNWVASALYVVGKLKDRSFIPDLKKMPELAASRERIVQTGLFWAWSRLHHPIGFEMFGKLIGSAGSPGAAASLMHFFSQLDLLTRFDLIQYLVTHHAGDTQLFHRFGEALIGSPIDFHREFDYLHLLWRNLPPDFMLPHVLHPAQ